MISINNLSVEFSARPLFAGASFVINPGDRIALTGKNGAGKSTLLKIIAGQQAPTAGSVDMPDDVTIGYLPQVMPLTDSVTVKEEARKAFAEIEEKKRELDMLHEQLERLQASESDEYARLLEKIERLDDSLRIADSARNEGEIEKTLVGLGFDRDDFERPTSEFSGGWRMRIELAKILLRRPDLLLLDEPTNHLDIESIQWLENFLVSRGGALLLVSHDRAFIDNVTKRTVEITCGRITDYKVPYSQYLTLRAERLEQQMRAYENQQKQIAEIKDFIERFRYKPTKSNQVQSRIKMLEKIVPIEVDEVDRSRLRLKFPPAPRSGDYPVIAEDVTKSYGEHLVFGNASFTLKRGEKVAFVGKNGQGKTTMVRCIMKEINDYTGKLTIGHNVEIGYFAQNQAALLDGELTVFETIDNIATGDIRTRVRDILGAFMFGGEASDKKVKVLSGGEKTRLAMICMLLTPVNLLILDEPTNHLDMASKDVLKQAVKDFDGTAIIVSHDRDFLSGLVDKVYEFGGGKMREEIGGISAFLNRLRGGDLAPAAVAPPSGGKKNGDESLLRQETAGKNAYAEMKERKRELAKMERKISDIESQIAALENDKAILEAKFAEGITDSDTIASYGTITSSLENAMKLWEETQENYDALKNQQMI